MTMNTVIYCYILLFYYHRYSVMDFSDDKLSLSWILNKKKHTRSSFGGNSDLFSLSLLAPTILANIDFFFFFLDDDHGTDDEFSFFFFATAPDFFYHDFFASMDLKK